MVLELEDHQNDLVSHWQGGVLTTLWERITSDGPMGKIPSLGQTVDAAASSFQTISRVVNPRQTSHSKHHERGDVMLILHQPQLDVDVGLNANDLLLKSFSSSPRRTRRHSGTESLYLSICHLLYKGCSSSLPFRWRSSLLQKRP